MTGRAGRGIVAVALGLWAGMAGAQSERAPAPDEVIAQYTAVGQPGPHHQALDVLAGRWQIEGAWFFAGGEPIRFTGTSENRWILGGRFLQCDSVTGEGANRIESTTLYGYDNRRKQHFVIGLDTLGTYFVNPWGAYDPGARTFALEGEETDGVSGQRYAYTWSVRVEGRDRHVLEVTARFPGKPPARMVELIYTRR